MDEIAAVDLFAGWGGFTQAAHQVRGVRVAWAANHWPTAVRVHAGNHRTVEHACQDLRQADFSAIARRHGPIRLVLASPACQGVSAAAQPARLRAAVRRTHDQYRATAWAVVDAAEVLQPDALVIENVAAFARWQLYPNWSGSLTSLGYTLREHVVDAAAWGVPQRRRRLFITAVRDRAGVHVPAGEHPELAFGPQLDHDARHDWKHSRRAPAGVQARIGRGTARFGGAPFLFQNVTGHSGIGLDEPIRTITCASCHWAYAEPERGRYRYLTGRELARAMGFADTYTWPDDIGAADVTRGLGNAVCPPAAAGVIGAVVDAIAA